MKRKTEINERQNIETTFDGLVSAISGVHTTLNAHAGRAVNISNCNRRQLYLYLKFYRTYPQIGGTLSPQFKQWLPEAIIQKVP